jgi:hypothetical protein
MGNASGNFERGKTYWGPTATIDTTYAESIGLEGLRREFVDQAPGTGSGVKSLRSGRMVICRLVRNVSGITLAPKRVVKWAAGYRMKRVDGYVSTDSEEAAGVVDEHLGTGGVRNGDLFWLARRGPTLAQTSLSGDVSNSIAEGVMLMALSAVTSQSTTSGRVNPFVATSNQTFAVSAVLNRLGRAISAKTTANTNADVLIDLELLD